MGYSNGAICLASVLLTSREAVGGVYLNAGRINVDVQNARFMQKKKKMPIILRHSREDKIIDF